jgi:hypothetical protein
MRSSLTKVGIVSVEDVCSTINCDIKLFVAWESAWFFSVKPSELEEVMFRRLSDHFFVADATLDPRRFHRCKVDFYIRWYVSGMEMRLEVLRTFRFFLRPCAVFMSLIRLMGHQAELDDAWCQTRCVGRILFALSNAWCRLSLCASDGVQITTGGMDREGCSAAQGRMYFKKRLKERTRDLIFVCRS